MKVLCSTNGIVDRFHPNQGLNDIKKAGFAHICLDLKAFQEYRKERMSQTATAENIERAIGELEAAMVIAPPLTENVVYDNPYQSYLELAKVSIRYAEAVGAQYVVVAPYSLVRTCCNTVMENTPESRGGEVARKETGGAAIDSIECDAWSMNRDFYLELASSCQNASARILLTNTCRDIGGHKIRGLCSDAVEARTWVEALNREVGLNRFGFCLDIGTCNLCGQNIQDVIITLDDCLDAVILRENDGIHDLSLLPFTQTAGASGGTDWLGVIRGLRQIAFDGMLVADFGDTASGFSPLLKPQLMQLVWSTTDYFRWQIQMETNLKKYEKIVLFGAGNMCRNFMKCYGDTYKPLFTCDNNSRLWGQEFCGLEIKSPEELKNLPEDCAVFICNVYYREIEQQLRRMGIANPIEYFNDEYMPSFYVDRIERND